MSVQNPTLTFPLGNDAFDTTDITRFYWEFNSSPIVSQTAYRVIIKQLNNTLVHDSGTISSSNEYYDLPTSTLLNGSIYKWAITTTSGSDSQTCREQIFYTRETATLNIDALPSPFNRQFYTFSATYAQPDGELPFSFLWTLYDEFDIEVSSSGILYGTTVEYEFTSLENGVIRKIGVSVTNQKGQTVDSLILTFTPSYTQPFDPDAIIATSISNSGTNKIDWTAVVAQTGDVFNINGDEVVSPTYVSGVWNQALELQVGETLVYDLNAPITEGFNEVCFLKLPLNYHGSFIKLTSDDNTIYEYGYDNVKDKFYYQRGYGKYQRRTYGAVISLPIGFFRIFMKSKYVGYQISGTDYTLR